MPHMYATVEQYQAAHDSAITAAALTSASLVVDELTIGAVYDVDANGMPTNPAVADALRDATIAQAHAVAQLEEQQASGTITPDMIQTASIMSASYTLRQPVKAKQGLDASNGIAYETQRILKVAGLLNAQPFGRW